GFDEGKKIPGSRAEEGDEKAELALHVSVLLGGNEAGFLVERSHEVEEAATAEFEAGRGWTSTWPCPCLREMSSTASMAIGMVRSWRTSDSLMWRVMGVLDKVI